jgi:hypothetical protein
VRAASIVAFERQKIRLLGDVLNEFHADVSTIPPNIP